MCRSPCMKLKPVSQHSGNPAKALREVKLFQNETREALWQLQTHCGRWLINKHLTNPLRDSEECAPTGKVPPPPLYFISDIRSRLFFFRSLHLQVEKCVWPEPQLQLGHHDSSSAPPSSLPHLLSTFTHTSNTTLLLRTSAHMLQPEFLATVVLQAGGGGRPGSYWEIKVESLEPWACCRWRWEGGGRWAHRSVSAPETFTISPRVNDEDRHQ